MIAAGAAIRDITPPLSVALYGYPHVERLATGVHDPLLATVIVLRSPQTTVALASLDLLMVEPPVARRWRRAVAAALACPEAGVFISCTHTHSGPVTSQLLGWQDDRTIPAPDADYLARVETQLVAAARAAAESAAPAELAWAVADATGVGGNRLAAGGLTDPECGILALRSPQTRQLLALALVYGMHPTVLHEDSTLISADFPHYARLHLQEQFGAGLPIAYHTAPCGDQSPRHVVAGQTFAEAERLGRRLGTAVLAALARLPEDHWQAEAPLGGRLMAVELPRNPIRPLPAAERLLADCQARYRQRQRDGAPRAEVRTAECAVFGAEGTLALARAEADGTLADRLRRDYQPVDLQALRLGDACLVGLPGECFTEYALEIKRRAPRQTFVASLVNGDLQGYIVTPAAAAAGGYEAANAIFAPAAGQILADTALAMLRQDDGR